MQYEVFKPDDIQIATSEHDIQWTMPVVYTPKQKRRSVLLFLFFVGVFSLAFVFSPGVIAGICFIVGAGEALLILNFRFNKLTIRLTDETIEAKTAPVPFVDHHYDLQDMDRVYAIVLETTDSLTFTYLMIDDITGNSHPLGGQLPVAHATYLVDKINVRLDVTPDSVNSNLSKPIL